MTERIDNIARDFNTPGIPGSGEYKPEKVLWRRWGRQIERAVEAGLSNGGLIFDTKEHLDADLAHGANSSAWVVDDPDPANSGIYRKSGASGSGSWSRISDLPYSFITLNDVGAGTANAIVATSDIPLPETPGKALITMFVYRANTGPVTISVNGEAPKALKTRGGHDLQEDYLSAGLPIVFLDDGTDFRLLSDVASAAIQDAAENAVENALAIYGSIGAVQEAASTAVAAAARSASARNTVSESLANAPTGRISEIELLLLYERIFAGDVAGFAMPAPDDAYMFTDHLGASRALVDTDRVGLALDSHAWDGLDLEELLASASESAPLPLNLGSGWTATAAASIVDADEFSTSGAGGVHRNMGMVSNSSGWCIEVEYEKTDGGTFEVRNTAGAAAALVASSAADSGTLTAYFVPTGGSGASLYFRLTAAGSARIVSMSLKEIPGFHSYQTQIGPRPTLYSNGVWFDGGKASTTDSLINTLVGGSSGNSFVAKVHIPPALESVQCIAGFGGASTTGRFALGVTTDGKLTASIGTDDFGVHVADVDVRDQIGVAGLMENGTDFAIYWNGEEVYRAPVPAAPSMSIAYRIGALNDNGTAALTLLGRMFERLAIQKPLTRLEMRTLARAWGVTVETAPGPVFNIETADDIDSLRDLIIDRVWSGNPLPTAGADTYSTDVGTSLISADPPANLLQVDQLRFNMTNNVTPDTVLNSQPWVYRPTPETSNNRLVINHHGHGDDPNSSVGYGALTYALVEAGFTVLHVRMPLGSASTHNTFPPPTDTLNYLKFFIEPVIRGLNELMPEGFESAHMVGISGGGWTTTICSAIDERIVSSVAVAGSMPLYLEDVGAGRDFEQYLPGLRPYVEYEDLYVMAGSPGRKHIVVYNTFDDCCFNLVSASKYSPYSQAVTTRAEDVGSDVTFRWVSNAAHAYNEESTALIIDTFSEGLES